MVRISQWFVWYVCVAILIRHCSFVSAAFQDHPKYVQAQDATELVQGSYVVQVVEGLESDEIESFLVALKPYIKHRFKVLLNKGFVLKDVPGTNKK